jgi:hypothetical protein
MSEEKKSLVPRSFRDEERGVVKVDDQAREELNRYRDERKKSHKPRRIIFAYDATGSRSSAWELAKSIQADMVEEVLQYGAVEVKIVVYRDRLAGDAEYLQSSEWSNDRAYLEAYMAPITCYGGGGNDGESVDEALGFALKQDPPADAVILIGDEPVVSRKRPEAYQQASELGGKGIPVFAFQEGNRHQTKIDFQTIAENSGGIYDQFTSKSPEDLKDRLTVIMISVTKDKQAVKDFMKKRQDSTKQLSEGAQGLARRLLKA